MFATTYSLQSAMQYILFSYRPRTLSPATTSLSGNNLSLLYSVMIAMQRGQAAPGRVD